MDGYKSKKIGIGQEFKNRVKFSESHLKVIRKI
jgi:hypothetical protein